MTKNNSIVKLAMALVLSVGIFGNASYADTSSSAASLSNTTIVEEQIVNKPIVNKSTSNKQFIETINVNTADAKALKKALKGVGGKKAKAIVAFRELHGPFLTIKEMTQVKGLGKSFMAKNEAKVVFE